MAVVSEEFMEEMSFRIISAAGTARSMYVNAVKLAKDGKFEKAHQMMEAGEKCFMEGHHTHSELLKSQSDGEIIPFSLLLVHCEDQLMSADCFKIMADEFIALYEKIIA